MPGGNGLGADHPERRHSRRLRAGRSEEKKAAVRGPAQARGCVDLVALKRIPDSKGARLSPWMPQANGPGDPSRLPLTCRQRSGECLDLRLYSGAGDGNRTRTISLGICAIRAVVRPDLRSGVSVSDRDRPLLTGVNGTLMARRSVVRAALFGVPCSSPPSSSIAAIPRAVAAESRLAKRPRSGSALTRWTRPRQSSSDEDGTSLGATGREALPLGAGNT
jgi:hypothetical protein